MFLLGTEIYIISFAWSSSSHSIQILPYPTLPYPTLPFPSLIGQGWGVNVGCFYRIGIKLLQQIDPTAHALIWNAFDFIVPPSPFPLWSAGELNIISIRL